MPTPPSEHELLGWFDTLSNWGRWGPDDRRGTLNHITPARRLAAAQLVREGLSVSCAWDIRTGRQPGAPVETQRYMLRTGLGLADEGRRDVLGGRGAAAQEFIGMVFHGLDITHIDSLSHVFWDGRMYGGEPASAVTDRQGALVHDVLAVSDGIVGRGVLLDVARVRGVDVLGPADHVYPADLEAAERAAGLVVGPGDIVLTRTGLGGRRIREGRKYQPELPSPGFQAACLPWLQEREVAALGSDTGTEPIPTGYDIVALPMHMIGMVAMGLWLIDNCELETLANACAERERWEFLFTVAPLRFRGATGAPVNPLALF
jgi:kynurenine formamidase